MHSSQKSLEPNDLESVTFTMDLEVHSLDQLPLKPKKVTQLKQRPCH